MVATMTAPVIVPLRWYGHHVDIRAALRDEDQPLFFALDVMNALNIDRELLAAHRAYTSGLIPYLPRQTQYLPGLLDETDCPAPLVTGAVASSMATARAEPSLADEFVAWVAETTRALTEPDTAASARHPEPGVVELAAGGTYSVRRAALILSRDPALDYGQNTLFTAMRDSLGWITRDLGIWIPTDDAMRQGWLLRHRVKIRTDRVTYPQVRVTDAGLRELHSRLGGIATLNLDPAPTLTLIEDI